MVTSELLRELVRRQDAHMLAQLYVEPDGSDEPTLWFAGDTPHRALVRMCDVGADGWGVIMALLTLAKRRIEPPEARVIPSRSSDPGTSKAAEPLSVKAGTQRARLLAAFGTPAAVDGLTDEEAADLAVGVPYRSEFAKRCSELRAAGLLEVVPDVTRRGVSGQRRLVSRITDAGRAALAHNGLEGDQ